MEFLEDIIGSNRYLEQVTNDGRHHHATLYPATPPTPHTRTTHSPTHRPTNQPHQTNEAEASLEALNEARGEKVGRLKVTERERDNLEGAKKEAEAFIQKDRDIRRKQNVLYQKNAHDAACNVKVPHCLAAALLRHFTNKLHHTLYAHGSTIHPDNPPLTNSPTPPTHQLTHPPTHPPQPQGSGGQARGPVGEA